MVNKNGEFVFDNGRRFFLTNSVVSYAYVQISDDEYTVRVSCSNIPEQLYNVSFKELYPLTEYLREHLCLEFVSHKNTSDSPFSADIPF